LVGGEFGLGVDGDVCFVVYTMKEEEEERKGVLIYDSIYD
jgi:hypothetical protein